MGFVSAAVEEGVGDGGGARSRTGGAGAGAVEEVRNGGADVGSGQDSLVLSGARTEAETRAR